MRDTGQVKDRVLVFERVEAGVVAEGALRAQFIKVHMAFENDFRSCGDLKVNRLALNQLQWLLA